MASLRRLVSSPVRALSLISSPNPSFRLLQSPSPRRSLLLNIWPKNMRPVFPLSAPSFQPMSNMQRKFALSGKKLLGGSFVGLSVLSGMMYSQPNVAYAMDDHYVDSGEAARILKDDIQTFSYMARKLQIPLLLVITVFLGWRHPVTLAINVVLLLFCTKPSPLSIYMFIEQLRQREMHQNPRLHKTKFLYTKEVKVENYRILCLATVELRDVRLNLIGILGNWWVFQTSQNWGDAR